MKKSGLFQEENSLLTGGFRQFFIGTQIAAVGGILNLILFGNKLIDSSNVLYFRLDFIAFVIGLFATFSLFFMLGRGQDLKVISAFLWLWAIIMAFTTWYEGGLYSTLMLSFPILFIFAAIFTERVAFLSICGFLSVVIVFMGLNHIYGWFIPPDGMQIEGVSRIISALVLSGLGSYVCWVFGSLLKSSFDELKRENMRVVQTQDTVRKLANYDGLTSSLNRMGAVSAYKALWKKIDVNQECVTAYFIDLDNFKSINDLFDHHAGDQLLITISDRLNVLLDQNGFVCRFGGDEFVVVVRADNNFDTEAFAISIMTSLRQPHDILGTQAEITASIGIASTCDKQTSFGSLCKKADMAMYRAKQSDKNGFHLYTDELKRQYMRNINIVNSLNSAINNDLLDVYFQPKINLLTDEIDGAEALLRWNRGNDEGIQPDEFIPIIESTELIHSIGAWVMNEACCACKQWQREGRAIKVAVNVSALQLTRASFYQMVVDALERNDLPPALLEIEITEYSLLTETPLVKMQLESLKKLGVSLAIDDFGTGYSNMVYLTQLQIDVLKLDRSFITQIDQLDEHRVIVTAVIRMAQVLGMKVVAEGIETEIERDVLRALNCDYGQGFLWSRAVPGSELITFGKY